MFSELVAEFCITKTSTISKIFGVMGQKYSWVVYVPLYSIISFTLHHLMISEPETLMRVMAMQAFKGQCMNSQWLLTFCGSQWHHKWRCQRATMLGVFIWKPGLRRLSMESEQMSIFVSCHWGSEANVLAQHNIPYSDQYRKLLRGCQLSNMPNRRFWKDTKFLTTFHHYVK